MQREVFSPLAIDALGEMMNISLGSSATAVSNMLDRRVDITTPKVSVVDIDSFSIAEIEPAMGVEIKYVSGLEGSNIMLLKKEDIKVIVDILMGQESDDTEFELNELTISAVCEVMNQMMGASATALSDFLGYSVNISTPSPFEMHDFNAFKRDHIPHVTNMIVVIRFALKIEDKLESEFMNVISVELARDLLGGLGLEEEDILGPEAHLLGETPVQMVTEPTTSNKPLTQEEIEKLMSGGAPAEPEVSNKPLSQEEIEKLMSGSAPAEPEVSNKPLSQEEIEKLMSGGAPAEPEVRNKPLSQEEIEKLMSGAAAPAPQPAPQPVPQPVAQPAVQTAPQPVPQQVQQMPQMPAQPMPQMPMYPMPDGQMAYPQGYYPPYPYPYPYPYPPQPEEQPKAAAKAEPKTINAKSAKMDELGGADALSAEQAQNLDLIMEVPLQVTVEIGRTRRKVHDILSYTKGSLVVLDKLAGDQVDLYVNGKCIAKGDVVVVDDNFGVRITEIIQMDGGQGLFSK